MTARNVQSQTKRRYCMDNLKTLREICNILEVTRRAVQGYEKAGLVTPSERNKYGYLLYNEIERNSLFRPTVAKEDRSLMNICFVMSEGNEALAPEFMEFAKSRGMVGIKGHRLVGGFRASCYNACPKESVEALVACMQEFEQMHK